MSIAQTERSFGLAVINTLEGRAEKRPVVAALLSCQPDDGDRLVIRRLINGAQGLGRKIALLDLNLEPPALTFRGEVDQRSLAKFLSEGGEGKIAAPAGGILALTARSEDRDSLLALGPGDLAKLIGRLEGSFDLILLTGPSPLRHSLGELIALAADLQYLIVRQEVTTLFQAQSTVERLRRLGIEPAGFIFSDRRYPIPQKLYSFLFRSGLRRRA